MTEDQALELIENIAVIKIMLGVIIGIVFTGFVTQ